MVHQEIEYKYRIKRVEDFDDKLKKLNAKFVAELINIDIYFSVPDNPEGKKYLRVRQSNDGTTLEYHYVVADDLTEESEIEINDAQVAIEILVNIGHVLEAVVDKKRRKYLYQNSEIVIDTVKRLGVFIEIESPTKDELLEIEKTLGLKEEDRLLGCGYPDMIKKLDKKKK